MRLEEIPFITHVPRDGRDVLLQPWYDHGKGEWDMYFEARPGDFVRIAMIDYHSGIYYSHRQVVNNDFEMPLAGLIAQHLCFKGVPRLLFSLIDDFNMLSACLKKIAIFASLEDDCSSFLIRSELEYLFSLVRAMYAILQKLVGKITRLLIPQDGGSAIHLRRSPPPLEVAAPTYLCAGCMDLRTAASARQPESCSGPPSGPNR